jgi:hypothetical protein
MKSLFTTLVMIFLSCQLSLASAFESFNSASQEFHQAFSHDQSIDHHHHDAFATHFDHGSSDASHQHVSDSFQSMALVSGSDSDSASATSDLRPSLGLKEPPSVFIDGWLRPPRSLV